MATLLHYFSDVITFGLKVDSELRSGVTARVDDLLETLRGMVKRATMLATNASKRPGDVEEARFGIVAWLDEIVARHPAAIESGAVPLQTELFGTRNAGNEFFAHLERLSPEQDEVREIYYIALCLGFAGQYYHEAGDSGELGRIKNLQSRHLPTEPAALHLLSEQKIFPSPYRVRAVEGPKIPGRWPERLAKAGVAASIALTIGIVGYFALWAGRLDDVAPQPAAVSAVLERYACGDFVAASADRGAVKVTGHVRNAAERDALLGELGALPGGGKISADLDVLGAPFCEAVQLIAPVRNLASDSRRVKVATRGGSDRLVEHEPIILDATVDGEPSCVYLSYLVADGRNVVHLAQPESAGNSCAVSNRTISIGEPSAGHVPWEVSPPFGREMVLAVVSKRPLFDGKRANMESPDAYLSALHEAINAHPGELAANYMLVTTEKRADK